MKRFAFLSMLMLLGLLCACTAANKKVTDIEQRKAEEHLKRGNAYLRSGVWESNQNCFPSLQEADAPANFIPFNMDEETTPYTLRDVELLPYDYPSNNINFDRAIEEYSKAIRLDPTLAEAYYNRGKAYSNKGDDDRAIKDYDTAFQLEPGYAEVYSWLRQVYNLKAEWRVPVTDSNEQ